jgi:sec-independent protein translocase protein TatC
MLLFVMIPAKSLRRNFRYALLLIAVAAAVVTPKPNATTMLIFLASMAVLYFVGVLISYAAPQNK